MLSYFFTNTHALVIKFQTEDVPKVKLKPIGTGSLIIAYLQCTSVIVYNYTDLIYQLLPLPSSMIKVSVSIQNIFSTAAGLLGTNLN